jgi:hypothetical protein
LKLKLWFSYTGSNKKVSRQYFFSVLTAFSCYFIPSAFKLVPLQLLQLYASSPVIAMLFKSLANVLCLEIQMTSQWLFLDHADVPSVPASFLEKEKVTRC